MAPLFKGKGQLSRARKNFTASAWRRLVLEREKAKGWEKEKKRHNWGIVNIEQILAPFAKGAFAAETIEQRYSKGSEPRVPQEGRRLDHFKRGGKGGSQSRQAVLIQWVKRPIAKKTIRSFGRSKSARNSPVKGKHG